MPISPPPKGRPYRYTFFSHQCAPVLIAATRASASPWYIIDSVMCTALPPPASWCAPWGGVRYFGGGEGVVGRGAVQVPILLVLYRREKDRRRKIYQVCCVFFAPAGRSIQGLPNGGGGGIESPRSHPHPPLPFPLSPSFPTNRATLPRPPDIGGKRPLGAEHIGKEVRFLGCSGSSFVSRNRLLSTGFPPVEQPVQGPFQAPGQAALWEALLTLFFISKYPKNDHKRMLFLRLKIFIFIPTGTLPTTSPPARGRRRPRSTRRPTPAHKNSV